MTKIYLVEDRTVYSCGCEASPHWDITTMYVSDDLAKAVAYCEANLTELENGKYSHSWYAICEHLLNVDNAASGELVAIYGINGKMDEQPVRGY